MLLLVLLVSMLSCIVLPVLLYGSFCIYLGGFMQLTLGALVVGLLLSLVLSCVANVCLVALQGASSTLAPVVLVRSLLAALAHPTLTGVVLLAMMFVLCLSAAHLVDLAESVTVLVEAHKAVVQRDVATAAAATATTAAHKDDDASQGKRRH